MYRVLKNEHFTMRMNGSKLLGVSLPNVPRYMRHSPLYAALLTVIFVFYPHMYGRGNGSESWPVTLGSSDGVKQVEAKSYDFDIYL